MSRRRSVPSYRLHRQNGQAIVTLTDAAGNRRDVLLGKYGTAESRVEYVRVVTEWEAAGRRLPRGGAEASAPSDLSVNDVILAFVGWVEQHYRRADGTPTSEVREYRQTLRAVRQLYGHTAAADFGPLALKAVRQKMVEDGLSRGAVNQLMTHSPLKLCEEMAELARESGQATGAAPKIAGEAQQIARTLQTVIRHRTAKPRKEDRDREIVRLHDDEGLSWKNLPGRLRKRNPAWVGPTGRPLSPKTVESY